jgi:hypothetical protein
VRIRSEQCTEQIDDVRGKKSQEATEVMVETGRSEAEKKVPRRTGLNKRGTMVADRSGVAATVRGWPRPLRRQADSKR